jgi:hypothetical protein
MLVSASGRLPLKIKPESEEISSCTDIFMTLSEFKIRLVFIFDGANAAEGAMATTMAINIKSTVFILIKLWVLNWRLSLSLKRPFSEGSLELFLTIQEASTRTNNSNSQNKKKGDQRHQRIPS